MTINNNNNIILKITKFDNENEIYENYDNEWILTNIIGDKYSLINKNDTYITIQSIFAWKTACLLAQF
jgi:hypothetical protein